MKTLERISLSLLAFSLALPFFPDSLHAQPQPAAARRLVASQPQSPSHRAAKHATGQLLVRFRRGVSKFAMEAAHTTLHAQVLRSYRVVENLQLIRLPEGVTVRQAAHLYRQKPEVLYAEPNYIYYADQSPVTPNDSLFADLWGLHNTGQNGGTPDADIDAPEAWSLSTGSGNVVVGVIDTGVDYNHQDLSGNMFRNPLDCNSNGVDDDGNGFVDDCYGIDTVNQDSDPMDDNGHGTHVSGTIGATGNNGVGVVGVNWQVKLMACKFLGADGSGFTSDAVTCLEYFSTMRDRGVNIVATNNSWGGGSFSRALLDAIDAHRQRGILFIAAAGNAAVDSDVDTFFPAGYFLPNLIAVAATDRSDALASFSNFGRHSVHLGAPGTEILSTVPGNSYGLKSGTSMAAPHVTGVAALLQAQDSTRDWKAIKNLLLAGGDTISALTNTITGKRLNAYGAMTCSNSTVRSRLQPRISTLYTSSGQPVTLAVLHINCATPNGSVQVSVDSGAATITLVDDGIGPDQEAGDGIYSGQGVWTSTVFETHTLSFPDNDVVTVNVVPPLSPYLFSTGVPFNYRNIAGTSLNLGDDDSALLTPPFPIQFGGIDFANLYVNSNGNVTFFGAFPFSFFNEALPVSSTLTLVAPFWDDLYPTTTGNVFWEVIGSQPNRELVIEWRDVEHYSCDTGLSVSFQVVFFEGSSDILFNYADTIFSDPTARGICYEDVDSGASATVGVQVEQGVATQFSFNTPSLADNTSILWQLGQLTPAITQFTPFSGLAGAAGFTLKVIGRDFISGSVLRWNGSDRPTTFVNSTELGASIPASDLATPGIVQVTVFNPPPSGAGSSTPVNFNVYSTYPVPSLISIWPDTVQVARVVDPPLTLTVTGTDFVGTSVARWNGVDHRTTVISSTQLTADIPSSELAAPGTAEVTVFNPAPGGGASNALTVTILNPIPTISFLDPQQVEAGAPAFTLRVLGSGFVSSSVVRWNGSDRPTTFVNSSELRTSIPASDIAAPGTAQVTVFNPAPGGGTSNAITFSTNKQTTTTTLTSSPNPSSAGQAVTFTATVSPSAATGTVTFQEGSAILGTGTLSGGVGSFSTSALAIGDHTITALYPGDATFASSTSAPLTQTVNKTASTTTLTSSLNPSEFGQSVTFTATVSPSAATGTVTFMEGSTTLGTGTLSGGVATFSTSALAVGGHSITAVYSGDANFSGSTSAPLTQTVNKTASTTTLTSSLNPSNAGQSVSFTATVAPTSATGTVTFMDGSTTLGTATLSNGTTTFSTSSLSPGVHSIAASYGGDASVAGSASASLSQAINSITITASPTSATVTAGQPAVFTLAVTQAGMMTSPISFNCSGLPAGASCSFNPPTVPAGSGTTSVSLTIATTGMARGNVQPPPGPTDWPFGYWVYACLALLALGMIAASGKQPRRRLRPALRLGLAVALLVLAACSGGQPPPPPPIQATVNATSGTTTGSITLTVNFR